MSRQAGLNWLLILFVTLCVVTATGPGFEGMLVSVIGIGSAVAAWRRSLAGYIGVLAVCAVSALSDAHALLTGSASRAVTFAGWNRPLLFGALALAFVTTRREFLRPR